VRNGVQVAFSLALLFPTLSSSLQLQLIPSPSPSSVLFPSRPSYSLHSSLSLSPWSFGPQYRTRGRPCLLSLSSSRRCAARRRRRRRRKHKQTREQQSAKHSIACCSASNRGRIGGWIAGKAQQIVPACWSYRRQPTHHAASAAVCLRSGATPHRLLHDGLHRAHGIVC
jgi:hypothetical protein